MQTKTSWRYSTSNAASINRVYFLLFRILQQKYPFRVAGLMILESSWVIESRVQWFRTSLIRRCRPWRSRESVQQKIHVAVPHNFLRAIVRTKAYKNKTQKLDFLFLVRFIFFSSSSKLLRSSSSSSRLFGWNPLLATSQIVHIQEPPPPAAEEAAASSSIQSMMIQPASQPASLGSSSSVSKPRRRTGITTMKSRGGENSGMIISSSY